MIINAIGTMFGTSGYDSHYRNLVNALGKKNLVRLTIPLPQNWHMVVNDLELEMIKRPPEKDEINLIITSPLFWKIHACAKRNWAYLVWEGDSIPKSWVEECMNPDIEYILVPSEHTKQALINTLLAVELPPKEEALNVIYPGLIDKIKIIPHGVDLEKFYYDPKKTEKFTFLANKGFRNMEDRGGIQYLIKAFVEEFKKDENVELKIKINPAYGIPDIPKMMPELKEQDSAPIVLITENTKYEDLVKLYNQSDVFVSPTRAESFNLPCIEALACGVPVITTNFGGQTDFVTEKNGWLIGGELTEIQHEVAYEGTKWLTPDIDELKKIMRQVYELGNAKDKKEECLKTAKKFTWENSAKLILNLV